MLAAALGRLDAFVFTAGIGENSITIRAWVAEKLAWLGIDFDPAANATGKLLISRPRSNVHLYVVPTEGTYDCTAYTFTSGGLSMAMRAIPILAGPMHLPNTDFWIIDLGQ